MKKVMLLAVCVMAVMMSCKNKDQSAPVTGDVQVADLDSVMAEMAEMVATLPMDVKAE